MPWLGFINVLFDQAHLPIQMCVHWTNDQCAIHVYIYISMYIDIYIHVLHIDRLSNAHTSVWANAPDQTTR